MANPDKASNAPLVLIANDQEWSARSLESILGPNGYAVLRAYTGRQAVELAHSAQPDAVILEIRMPDMDGLEVCQRIQRDGWTPVLMLTARTEEADKVAGFAVGADDYLTKPFSLRELAARVQAILRRRERIEGSADGAPIERHGLLVDGRRRLVEVDGEEIQLTPLEFEILHVLAREPGVVLSRDQLMDRIWGYRDHAGGRVVDSHVARLRRKLGEDGNDPRFIRTVHGVGYGFRE
jgi:DNA-binding response OmpR family regulator